MIGIQLDGEDDFLELPPDVSINIKLENPIFGDPDRLSPGSFSLPFDIPGGSKSPSNASKLKNPDVIENIEAYQIQKAKLFFNGVPFRSGNIRSKESTLDRISTYFTFGLNSIHEGFKTAKLRSVVTDVFTLSVSQKKKIYLKKVEAGGDLNVTLNGANYIFPNTALGILDFNVQTQGEAFERTLDKSDVWHPVVFPGSDPSPGGIDGTFLYVVLLQHYTVSPGVYDTRLASDPLLELHLNVDIQSDYIVEADLGTLLNDARTFVNDYLNDPYPNGKIRFPVRFNPRSNDEKIKESDGVNLAGSDGLLLNEPNWGFNNSPSIEMVDAWKNVKVATTVEIVLSGEQMIDGISVEAGHRVLVKNQSDAEDNGIYVCDAGAWSRSGDANTAAELEGAGAIVQEGKVNISTKWVQMTEDIVLGTTAVVWEKITPFEVKNFNSLQPFVLMKYALDRIGTVFGFQWEGDFYESDRLTSMTIDNSFGLDVAQNFIGSKKFIFWKRSFSLSDLVPDVTVVDFLKMLQGRYNLAVYYNERTKKVCIKYREVIAKTKDYEEITSISSPKKSVTDLRLTGQTLVIPADETDALSQKEQQLVGEVSEEEVEIKCGRLFRTSSTLVEGLTVDGPLVSQPFGSKGQFRIFHYTGLKVNGTFVYASAAIQTDDGPETLPLLYNNYHKYWLNQVLNRRSVKLSVNYVYRLLKDYDFELARRFDRNEYIIKSIEFNLTNKGCTISDVELYTK